MAEPEQAERVQVYVAAPQPPVQARTGTTRMAGQQFPDHRTPGHPGPGRHRRLDRLVAGSQAGGVLDGHQAPVHHRTGERDHPVAGGQHRQARRTGEVHPSMAGAVRGRRRLEPARHDLRCRHRPGEDRAGRARQRRRCGPTGRQHGDQADEQGVSGAKHAFEVGGKRPVGPAVDTRPVDNQPPVDRPWAVGALDCRFLGRTAYTAIAARRHMGRLRVHVRIPRGHLSREHDARRSRAMSVEEQRD